MGRRQVYHVKKTEEGWQGKLASGKKASVVGKKKEDVVQRTIKIARNAGKCIVKIHGMDDKVQETRQYD
jgi:hypothetical protein